jgi:hypothetical protein
MWAISAELSPSIGKRKKILAQYKQKWKEKEKHKNIKRKKTEKVRMKLFGKK